MLCRNGCQRKVAEGYMICKKCMYLRPRKAPKRRNTPEGHIYLCKDAQTGYYKIGKTSGTWKERIATAMAFLIFPPELVAWVKVTNIHLAETLAHTYFKRYHTEREWYNIHPLKEELVIESLFEAISPYSV